MTITAKRLEDVMACRSQVAAFRAIWGENPAPMTVDAAVENADTFSWDWAARHLLTPDNRAEYKRATAPALAEYNRVGAQAWAKFKRATAQAVARTAQSAEEARAEYNRVDAQACAEFKRATAPALAEYQRACARAFATIYIKQEAAA